MQSNEVAIPEIQRPFVWSSTQVRDLVDSLYNGFPVGYLITWKNPNVRLKDGSISNGKRILIDGQQRVTALMTAILGKEVFDSNYRRRRITIAFNPTLRKFEVLNSIIKKDSQWISDISEIFSPGFKTLDKIRDYCALNPEVSQEDILHAIDALKSIMNITIGLIELNPDVDIDEVTEIFIRINSSDLTLSQVDFAMSKIAVDEIYGGNLLRKAIDYFSHLAVKPEFMDIIRENDAAFMETEYFPKLQWLKDNRENLYDPDYKDIIRVAFTYKFRRGPLQELVALLWGRNFETREYQENIAEESFAILKEGVLDFMNETHFRRFIMIIRSAGFIDPFMIRSKNALNFSYVLYLTLKENGVHPSLIETYVRRWFEMSVLKSRYSSSPESQFSFDIKRLTETNPIQYMEDVWKSELSDAYWEYSLPLEMDTSVTSHPLYHVFLAAQVKLNDKGFLSKDILVSDLIKLKGDMHHIYPREFLKNQGFDKGLIHQIANFAVAQSEIKIAIGKKDPRQYFTELVNQCNGGPINYGGITSFRQLEENLAEHCIPLDFIKTSPLLYHEFLLKRRQLMASKIRRYFGLL
ncbi:MAG: hypothetical protein PWR20_928 [Bacteroidales bacterium]|nr:hypothetical protein [Bacteroidales bacterium]MDN5329901.1 hypothetical protein [Bacteroidales bacterium]